MALGLGMGLLAREHLGIGAEEGKGVAGILDFESRMKMVGDEDECAFVVVGYRLVVVVVVVVVVGEDGCGGVEGGDGNHQIDGLP